MNGTSSVVKKFRKELKAGTVALSLLGILDSAREPMYGYRIAKRLESGLEKGPEIKQGAIYPVLRSLEKSGLLESEVEPSVSGPPRRYYRITDAGRDALAEWKVEWENTKIFMEAILKGNHDA